MMEYILIGLMVLIAFVAGMAAYHDIHVAYMNRDLAKKRRQRDHTRKWCQCSIV